VRRGLREGGCEDVAVSRLLRWRRTRLRQLDDMAHRGRLPVRSTSPSSRRRRAAS